MRSVAVMVTLLLGTAIAHGQPKPQSTADVLSPQLSELSSDVIFAVSKRLQHTQEAPAIVRVFTQEQIRRHGFRNLNELLASIPEVELVDTGRYQYLLFKGAPFTVLALLDGVSLVNHFDNTVDLERLVPIEIVRKVEVVLSPGGVLWGAHSVYGVVNVITKQSAARSEQHIALSGGSWGTARAALSASSAWADLAWQAHLSVQTYRSKSVRLEHSALTPVGVFEGRGETENDTGLSLHAFGSLRWQGWFLRALALVFDEHPYAIHEGTGARARQGENSVIQLPTLSAAAGHRRTLRWGKLALALRGQAFLYHQAYHDEASPYPTSSVLPDGTKTVDRIERQIRFGTSVEAQASYRPSTTTLGAELFRATSSERDTYHRWADNVSRLEQLPALASVTGSIYGQEELQLHRDVNLAAGARINLSDSYSTALLLHGHVVYEPIDGFWLKANYSEGYRPPSFEQRFLDAEYAKGDESLNPEQSRVLELQASYWTQFGRLKLQLTGGYTYAAFDDLIALVQASVVDDRVWLFRNLGEEQIQSVSLLSRVEIPRVLTAGAYSAFHFPVAKGGETRQDFARLRIALDVTLLYFNPLTVTMRYGYTGDRRLLGYFDPVQKIPTEITVDGYHELAITARVPLPGLPFYLSGTLRNLLHDRYDHIPPYTHAEHHFRGPFPQPSEIHGFLVLGYHFGDTFRPNP